MSVEENIKRLKEVDEVFRTRDWPRFDERHAKHVVAHSPMTLEPTEGIDAHRDAVKRLLATFPDISLKQESAFGQGDWVCSLYTMTGTHKGPLQGPGGKEIPPTNKPVRVTVCAVTRLREGQIEEEHIFFDRMVMMGQLGIMGPPAGK